MKEVRVLVLVSILLLGICQLRLIIFPRDSIVFNVSILLLGICQLRLRTSTKIYYELCLVSILLLGISQLRLYAAVFNRMMNAEQFQSYY